MTNPVFRKPVAILVVVGGLWLPTSMLSQDETDDILIVDDEISISEGTEMSVFGNVTLEVNSKITNSGELKLNAKRADNDVYNFSSDSAFSGKGIYSFLGRKHHYLSGDYNTQFYNLTLDKGMQASLISELPELQIMNVLELRQGVLDVQDNLVRIENADSNAIDTKFLNIYSFIDGRLIRRVNYNGSYHFPISQSKIIRSIILENHYSDIKYMDVSFIENSKIDLSSQFGIQYGISYFQELDETGAWQIHSDLEDPEGYMDVEAYIANFNEYGSYEDNMFGLLQSDEYEPEQQDWEIEGDMEYYDSPYRRTGTLTTKLRNAEDLGYYAVGVAERQKFVNLIAPGGGRETKFIIQGLVPGNQAVSHYDLENCELVVYNIFGAKVWDKKPYENDLDLKDFMDGTYYYEFKFTINGRPGSIQSYIDVKRMD